MVIKLKNVHSKSERIKSKPPKRNKLVKNALSVGRTEKELLKFLVHTLSIIPFCTCTELELITLLKYTVSFCHVYCNKTEYFPNVIFVLTSSKYCVVNESKIDKKDTIFLGANARILLEFFLIKYES